ncbi:hypothetical protein F5890DRAFT_1514549 [Lentinula detonsa]|uniref:Uncharacterized protein n=1 Tax=Lentinula detonsa TaxID=2804962 RepID=A0AA38Q0T5_9AGAR|nr:hypothetical protein F5890DRAFT_1514549 [Lentinula detonsa]
MPKRIATPPSDTNTRYFTICFPYPLNASWELKADQISFARWIVSCIKKEYFIAIMYKPTARGMVIIEVDRAFKDEHRTLLGEHRWIEFLKQPSDEERSCCSQIFYSVYTDHRGAQKDGWKTINVRDEWFDSWQSSSDFKYPYPLTHWCALPPEDKTSKRMCRPLPIASFPPPLKPVRPVVGSSAWVQSTTGPDPKSPGNQRAAWGNNLHSPAIKASNSSTNSRVAKSFTRSHAPSAGKPLNVWGSQKSAAALLPVSKGPTFAPVKAPQGAWGSQKPAVVTSSASKKALSTSKSNAASSSAPEPPQYPPGLPTVPTHAAVPPGLVYNTVPDFNSDSTSRFDWASEVEAEFPTHSVSQKEVNDLADSANNMIIADDMEKLYRESDSDEDFVPESYPVAFEGRPPSFALAHVEYNDTKDTVMQNLWEDVATKAAEKEDPEECPVHGPLCSKGICQVAKKKKRANEAQKGKDQKNGRGRGRRNEGRNNDRTKAQDDGDREGDNDERESQGENSHQDSSDPSASRTVSRNESVKEKPQFTDHNDTTDLWENFDS